MLNKLPPIRARVVGSGAWDRDGLLSVRIDDRSLLKFGVKETELSSVFKKETVAQTLAVTQHRLMAIKQKMMLICIATDFVLIVFLELAQFRDFPNLYTTRSNYCAIKTQFCKILINNVSYLELDGYVTNDFTSGTPTQAIKIKRRIKRTNV